MNTTPWASINKGVGSTYPAYYVDLDDITGEDGFLDKINQLIGCDTSSLTTDSTRYHSDNVPVGCYRLPTEAEWEYSARAAQLRLIAMVMMKIILILVIMLGTLTYQIIDQSLLDKSYQILGVCSICMEISKNGQAIVSTRTLRVL